MRHLSQWLKANRLTLNIQKTYYMVFHRGRRKSHNNVNYVYIDDAIIEDAFTVKYLGVILDNNLKWTPLMAFVKNKVAKGIGIIRKASKFLAKATLCNLYYVHLSPLKLMQKKYCQSCNIFR